MISNARALMSTDHRYVTVSKLTKCGMYIINFICLQLYCIVRGGKIGIHRYFIKYSMARNWVQEGNVRIFELCLHIILIGVYMHASRENFMLNCQLYAVLCLVIEICLKFSIKCSWQKSLFHLQQCLWIYLCQKPTMCSVGLTLKVSQHKS